MDDGEGSELSIREPLESNNADGDAGTSGDGGAGNGKSLRLMQGSIQWGDSEYNRSRSSYVLVPPDVGSSLRGCIQLMDWIQENWGMSVPEMVCSVCGNLVEEGFSSDQVERWGLVANRGLCRALATRDAWILTDGLYGSGVVAALGEGVMRNKGKGLFGILGAGILDSEGRLRGEEDQCTDNTSLADLMKSKAKELVDSGDYNMRTGEPLTMFDAATIHLPRTKRGNPAHNIAGLRGLDDTHEFFILVDSGDASVLDEFWQDFSSAVGLASSPSLVAVGGGEELIRRVHNATANLVFSILVTIKDCGSAKEIMRKRSEWIELAKKGKGWGPLVGYGVAREREEMLRYIAQEGSLLEFYLGAGGEKAYKALGGEGVDGSDKEDKGMDVGEIVLALAACTSRPVVQKFQDEQDRLATREAWRTYLTYRNAARWQNISNQAIMVTAVFLNVAVSGVTVAYVEMMTLSDEGDYSNAEVDLWNLWMDILYLIGLVLVVVRVAVMMANSYINGLNKWVQLELCSEQVYSEIWQYRTRDREYSAREFTLHAIGSSTITSYGEHRRKVFSEEVRDIAEGLLSVNLVFDDLVKATDEDIDNFILKKQKENEDLMTLEHGLDSLHLIDVDDIDIDPIDYGSDASFHPDYPDRIVDNCIAVIGPATYKNFRIVSSIYEASSKLSQLDSQERALTVAINIAMCIAAILAAINWFVFLVFVTEVTMFLRSATFGLRVDFRRANHGKLRRTLTELVLWWDGLSHFEQSLPVNRSKLAEVAEEAIMMEALMRTNSLREHSWVDKNQAERFHGKMMSRVENALAGFGLAGGASKVMTLTEMLPTKFAALHQLLTCMNRLEGEYTRASTEIVQAVSKGVRLARRAYDHAMKDIDEDVDGINLWRIPAGPVMESAGDGPALKSAWIIAKRKAFRSAVREKDLFFAAVGAISLDDAIHKGKESILKAVQSIVDCSKATKEAASLFSDPSGGLDIKSCLQLSSEAEVIGGTLEESANKALDTFYALTQFAEAIRNGIPSSSTIFLDAVDKSAKECFDFLLNSQEAASRILLHKREIVQAALIDASIAPAENVLKLSLLVSDVKILFTKFQQRSLAWKMFADKTKKSRFADGAMRRLQEEMALLTQVNESIVDAVEKLLELVNDMEVSGMLVALTSIRARAVQAREFFNEFEAFSGQVNRRANQALFRVTAVSKENSIRLKWLRYSKLAFYYGRIAKSVTYVNTVVVAYMDVADIIYSSANDMLLKFFQAELKRIDGTSANAQELAVSQVEEASKVFAGAKSKVSNRLQKGNLTSRELRNAVSSLPNRGVYRKTSELRSKIKSLRLVHIWTRVREDFHLEELSKWSPEALSRAEVRLSRALHSETRSKEGDYRDIENLINAWRVYLGLKKSARLLRDSHRRLVVTMLFLQVFGAALVCWRIDNDFFSGKVEGSVAATNSNILLSLSTYDLVLYLVSLAVFVALVVVTAMEGSWRPTENLVFLEVASARIRSEIYKCRVSAEVYTPERLAAANCSRSQMLNNRVTKFHGDMTREMNLSNHSPADVNREEVETFLAGLKFTNLAQAAIDTNKVIDSESFTEDYVKDLVMDQGVTPMTAAQYEKFRLASTLLLSGSQFWWAEQSMRVLRAIENVAPLAAVGIAAYDLIWWAPLTIAIGFGALSYRLSLNLDAKLVTAHEAIIELNAVLKWWRALSATERSEQVNVDKLVFDTEKAILRRLTALTDSGGVVTSFDVLDSSSESDASTDEDDDCGTSRLRLSKHGPLQASAANNRESMVMGARPPVEGVHVTSALSPCAAREVDITSALPLSTAGELASPPPSFVTDAALAEIESDAEEIEDIEGLPSSSP